MDAYSMHVLVTGIDSLSAVSLLFLAGLRGTQGGGQHRGGPQGEELL